MSPRTPTVKKQSKSALRWARFKDSCRKTMPYIRLQTKLAFAPGRKEKRHKRIIKLVVNIFVFILIMFLLFFLLRSLVTQSTKIPGKSISIAIFTIAQLVLLVMAVAAQCRRLYRPIDFRIISTFPLTSFQRYIGEIIAIYVRLLFFSIIFFWPLMMDYGAAMASGATETVKIGEIFAFLFSSLFASLLLPLLPFAISLVISVPFMFLTSWLSTKHVAKLVLFVLGFIILLTIYSLILNFMAEWYIHAKNNVVVMEGIRDFLKGMNKPYNPSYWTSEICIQSNIGVNFAALIGISAALTAIGIAITKPLYHKFSTSAQALENIASTHKTKISDLTQFQTIIAKEAKQILRTETYAYFYLGVAFSMPIMTYLIADIVRNVGEQSTGNHIFFGFALMILFIILSLIGSFSANAISREGSQFYITKVSPISYRKQMLAKALVNFGVTFVCMLLCIIVLAATANKGSTEIGLTAVDIVFLFFTSLFFLVGITFNGINLNLARPKIDINNSTPNESNVVIQLLIALAITAFVTVITIVVDGVAGASSSLCHGIMLALMATYAIVNFVVFFFTVEKKYAKIEAK